MSLLQPPSQKGIAADLSEWKSVAELSLIAQQAFSNRFPNQRSNIDRLDVRPSKGMVKVLFEKGWWEIQLDGKTGALLSFERRHSDWIEALHDGSIIHDSFKVLYMVLLGLGIILMILSGIWLWWGPVIFRKEKRKH